MAKILFMKKIISVGCEFPDDNIEYIPFRSDQSLLDADIILFEPDCGSSYSTYHFGDNRTYCGKPSFNEKSSSQVQDDIKHWKSELHIALDAGKTVIVFLSKLEEFYVATGEVGYSGTGKNARATNYVKLLNNYLSLPVKISRIVPKGGKEVRVAGNLQFLSPYWKEFSRSSAYEIYLEDEFKNVVLTTKTGDKVVGAIIDEYKGTMLLLPPLRYKYEEFVEENDEGDEIWTSEAQIFGKKLVNCLDCVDVKKLNCCT